VIFTGFFFTPCMVNNSVVLFTSLFTKKICENPPNPRHPRSMLCEKFAE